MCSLRFNALDGKVFTTAEGLGDGAGGDSWRWLRWQSELELADQELEFEFGVGVAAQEYLASICCWQAVSPGAKAWRRRVKVMCIQ